MKLIPWSKSGETTVFDNDSDDFWPRLFGDGEFLMRPSRFFKREFFPAMNISETEDAWKVTFELPGMSQEDINLQLMGRQLVLTGERKREKETKGKEFRRVESQYGSFERTLTLPEGVRAETESVAATFEKGILEVRLPKLEPTPSKEIPVKTK